MDLIVGLLAVIALFGLPLALLFYVAAKRRRHDFENNATTFLFGGLTVRRAIYSTIGGVTGVSLIIGFLVGAGQFYGFITGIAVFFAITVIYPVALYFILTSPSTRHFFTVSNRAARRQGTYCPRTLLSFLSSGEKDPFSRFLYYFMIFSLGLYLFLESAMVLVVLEILYSSLLGDVILIYFLMLCVIVAYVSYGGFRAVLDTDRIQFFIIFSVFVSLLVFVAVTPGHFLRIDLLETFQASGEVPLQVHTDLSPILIPAGIVFIAGFWFLSAPDMWFRLTHAVYGFHGPRGALDLDRWKSVPMMFVTIALLFIPLVAVATLIGAYGLANEGAIELPAELSTATRWSLGAVYTFGEIINDFALGSVCALVILFVISLASMSTIDSSLITTSQITHDYITNISREDRWLEVNDSRVFILKFAMIPLLVPIVFRAISYGIFDRYDILLSTISHLGFMMALIAGNIFFIFMTKVIVPTWCPRTGSDVAYYVVLPTAATFLLSLMYLQGVLPLPFMEPQDHYFEDIGTLALIHGVVFSVVFLAGAWGMKKGVRSISATRA